MAAQIKSQIKSEISMLKDLKHIPPGLAVILVGNRDDSRSYVSLKQKACREVEMNSLLFEYPPDTTQSIVINKIKELNKGNHEILFDIYNNNNNNDKIYYR
jgi:methylenetetrahydrofolate dehydrogenase (NADP+)/methenyltetrahydrofolate cyclohydrolase